MTETIDAKHSARKRNTDRRHHRIATHGRRTRLSTRVRVRIRPLERSDRDALAMMFDRLSEASRNRRFLGPKPMLSDRDLAHLADVDHVEHEAFAAIDAATDSIIGVVRYVRSPLRADVAEVACEVIDEWQGRGVGRQLGSLLIQRARSNSIHRLTASASSDNVAALALLRRFGFATVKRSLGVSELQLAL